MVPRFGTRSHRYLSIGLGVSLLVHISVLALHFHAPAPASRPIPSSLEVVLLNASTDSVPVQATVLAQANMDGGGDSEDGVAARSPLPPSPTLQSAIPVSAQQARLQELEAKQRELMTLLQAQYAQYAEARTVRGTQTDALSPGVREPAEQTVAQLAQQYAAISQRVEDYNRRPRRHYFAPSASAVPFAHYVEEWRERVESIGNRYYPDAARGRVYGSLRATVFIRADGSLEDMVFDAPSEHAVLNDAARAIVNRAVPFAPFPASIKRDTDVIAITRTWHFQNDAISTETP